MGTSLQFEMRDLVIRIIFRSALSLLSHRDHHLFTYHQIAVLIPIKFTKVLYDRGYGMFQTIMFEFSFK